MPTRDYWIEIEVFLRRRRELLFGEEKRKEGIVSTNGSTSRVVDTDLEKMIVEEERR